MKNDFIVFAHRGASGYEPENTLLSFRKAIDIGAKAVELDVYFVENELIVFHDERLDRTTNGTGLIYEQSLDYLRSLDAGKGEKIPYLPEVFDLISGKAIINVELKGKNTAKPVAQLIDKYIKNQCQNRKWDYDKFIVSSFNHKELVKIKKLQPKIKIGVLMTCLPINYAQYAKKLGAYSAHHCIEFINQDFIINAHKLGLKVFVYTVNCRNDLKRMKKINIDGVFTNYPDLIV